MFKRGDIVKFVPPDSAVSWAAGEGAIGIIANEIITGDPEYPGIFVEWIWTPIPPSGNLCNPKALEKLEASNG